MEEAAREKLHELLDALPESKIKAVKRYLESLADEAFLEALRNAPEDDEPLTEDELRAIEEGREAVKRGETTPLEDVMREFISRPARKRPA